MNAFSPRGPSGKAGVAVIQTTNNFPVPDAQERNGRLAADSGATPTLSDLGLDFRG